MTHTLFLVDGAQVLDHAPWMALLEQLHSDGEALALYGTENESLHSLGPWLCRATEAQKTFMDEMFKKHPGHYLSALYLTEGYNWHLLAKQWQTHFNQIACTSSRDCYYLRYADVRVLEALPRVMNPLQWKNFTSGIAQWVYVDRSQKFKTITPGKQETSWPEGPLSWSDEQLAELIELTWPDALLAQVYELRPQYNNPDLHAQQYAVALDAYQQAKASGHGDDTPYQVQACLQALNHLQHKQTSTP